MLCQVTGTGMGEGKGALGLGNVGHLVEKVIGES